MNYFNFKHISFKLFHSNPQCLNLLNVSHKAIKTFKYQPFNAQKHLGRESLAFKLHFNESIRWFLWLEEVFDLGTTNQNNVNGGWGRWGHSRVGVTVSAGGHLQLASSFTTRNIHCGIKRLKQPAFQSFFHKIEIVCF